jgi:hypothetical protein
MPDARETALRRNFHYFQGIVGGLMEQHAGKYALLHSGGLVDVFTRPIEAVEAGYRQFTDGDFSIQKVTDRPFDLGFMSYGSGERPAD